MTITATSLVDGTYALLRERILEGTLAPGTHLRQIELSRELGVSRTPLREALARLAVDGLVKLQANRGARVGDVATDDIAAAFEARLAIEPAAAGLAATRRGDDDLQALRTQLARQREAETVSDSFEANRAFHLAIVSAARNLHLLRVAQSVWGGREGVRAYELMRPAVAERDLAEHAELLAAIARGEAEGAERLAREHVARAMRELLS